MAMEAPLPSKRCKLYWEAEEQQSILQLMLGSPASAGRALASNMHRGLQDSTTTAMVSGLLDGPAGARLHDDPLQQKFNESFELDSESPLPPGWEKCLDLKTGSMYYLERNSGLRTPIDPRRKLRGQAAALHANHHHLQPSSPSSSSELTTEPSMACSVKAAGSLIAATAEVKPPPCKRPRPTSAEERDGFDSDDDDDGCAVDLTLSLGPSSSNKKSRNGSADPRFLLCPPGEVIVKEKETTTVSCYETNGHQHHQQTPVLAAAAVSASSREEYEQYARSSNNSNKNTNLSMNFGSSRYPPPAAPQGSSSLMMMMMSSSSHGMMKKLLKEEDEDASYAVVDGDTMVTAGCPHCLMFVMLSRSADPRCPKCAASLSDAVTQMENAAAAPTPLFSSITASQTDRFC